jgi:predicted nucleic acid-binding protein
MKKVFVDTNVFLRFFTKDDEGQHTQAAHLFEQARDGKLSLVTGPPVLFEIAWTLKSAYRLSNEKVLHFIDAIAAIPNMTLIDKETVAEALGMARRSHQAFADAYIAASATSCADELATFNTKHFKALDATLFKF